MNSVREVFFEFILPGGTTFPCLGKDGELDFPWARAMEFIETARKVFSSHQINNAFACLSCDELIMRFESGERDVEFMFEVASFVESLRKRWHMDGKT